MTCRIEMAGFLALLTGAVIFVLVAQVAGGLVWRGQTAMSNVEDGAQS